MTNTGTMKNVLEMNFIEFFDLLGVSEGKKIVMEFVNRKTQELKKITGIIKKSWSKDFSPSLIVETETKEEQEVFADEVLKFDLEKDPE